MHGLIGKAEVVADLVNEDVTHDRAQRVLVLGPVIQNRAAIEED